MEYIGKEGTNTVHGTVHYGLNGAQHQYSESGITLQTYDNLNETFHRYAVDRSEGEVRWYIDDIEYSSVTKNEMQPYLWPFDDEFYFLINLAVGGNWPGDPATEINSSIRPITYFPQYLSLDYVRVYEGIFPWLAGKSVVDCTEEGVVYEIVNIHALYKNERIFSWTLPSGVTVINGEGTSQITVNFDSIIKQNRINDSEIINVRLLTKIKSADVKSIGIEKLQNGIGLRVKVVDLYKKCLESDMASQVSEFSFDCGRPETCTEHVLQKITDEFSCGQRIQYLMNEGMDELQACAEVACK